MNSGANILYIYFFVFIIGFKIIIVTIFVMNVGITTVKQMRSDETRKTVSLWHANTVKSSIPLVCQLLV